MMRRILAIVALAALALATAVLLQCGASACFIAGHRAREACAAWEGANCLEPLCQYVLD